LPGPLARAQRRVRRGRISPQIEHRLFSHITLNWRGRPLTSHEVVVKTIAATRTSGGLRVEAALDSGDYPTGIAISRQRMDALPIQRHAMHGTWNYTLHPRLASCASEAAHAAEPGSPALRRQAMLRQLADPRLTGMTSTQLERLAGALAPPRPPGPSSATANSAEAEPDGQQETSAASHSSTMPHAC
jgi:hypothetical protein